MEDAYFKKIIMAVLLGILILLTFLLIRPVLLSIITGFVLAFIFIPLYDWIQKKVKSENISATICSILLVLILILPLWFLTPLVLAQLMRIYVSVQQIDFVGLLKNIFPALLGSEQFSIEAGSILRSFITRSTNSFINYLSDMILNLPNLALKFVVVLFTFFFTLRDREQIINYVRKIVPFPRDVEKKIFDATKRITSSVIYGQILIGMFQGIIAGLGFIIFRVPNALILGIVAMFAGIFPIIGPALIWVPVVIYLFIVGNNLAAIGVLIFGSVASLIDNFLRPTFVSKRTRLSPPLILIGMIGGLFFFGILGLILGPLIIAYLLIILEVYQNRKPSGILIKEESKQK